jgi:hypothetical protein
VTDIATKLGFETITLEDAATFCQIETMPYFGSIFITPYLRALRGYGYYEGYGFFLKTDDHNFPATMAEQQSTLYFIHHLFTMTIGEIKSALRTGGGWNKGLQKHIFQYLENQPVSHVPRSVSFLHYRRHFVQFHTRIVNLHTAEEWTLFCDKKSLKLVCRFLNLFCSGCVISIFMAESCDHTDDIITQQDICEHLRWHEHARKSPHFITDELKLVQADFDSLMTLLEGCFHPRGGSQALHTINTVPLELDILDILDLAAVVMTTT